MISTVLAHSTPQEHKESHEISGFVGISVAIVIAIIFYKIYGSIK